MDHSAEVFIRPESLDDQDEIRFNYIMIMYFLSVTLLLKKTGIKEETIINGDIKCNVCGQRLDYKLYAFDNSLTAKCVKKGCLDFMIKFKPDREQLIEIDEEATVH